MEKSGTEIKILEAAKKVFIANGLYGARMQDIADMAGINKALLHYYFRNKEKLFDRVFEGALSKYFNNLIIFSDVDKTLKDRLFTYVDSSVDFYAEYPQMSLFLIKEISSHPVIFREKVAKIIEGRKGQIKSGTRMMQYDVDFPEGVDFYFFLVNLHSLCAFPFIAAPIMKTLAVKNELNNEDPGNERLKNSIKEFIQFKLQKK